MNIAELAIRKKTINLFAIFLIIAGGILAYENLGRLEDPDFTVKEAKVITRYPGATPKEVEQEVTDIIETEIQQMPELKWIKESLSKKGESIITPQMEDIYWGEQLNQVWDELRRKVLNVQGRLPPGAQVPEVSDDFGDVFGVFLAVTGEGYSYREIKDYVDLLRRELLLVPGVAKISLWGAQQEQIFVEVSRNRIAQLGIPLGNIYETLGEQNKVADGGDVKVGSEYVTINPSGKFDSVEAISDLLIKDPSGEGRLIYMRDVAEISRGYQTPPANLMRYDGKPALGIGISTKRGGNVVEMGDLVGQRLEELVPQMPLGMKVHIISFQGEAVTKAIDAFIVNLAEAVAIVIGVLLLFMGLRPGLLIGFVLIVTILATFIVMQIYGITLQRISLGALIIALGMLVDNAIVVTDGILVRINRGMDKIQAANEIVNQTAMPMLGGTAIAVLAFAPIGLSADSTGEYCQSLFQVLLISLLLSWFTAITITPLLCHMLLKPKPTEGDPYGGRFYKGYRGFLGLTIRFRYVTLLVLVGMLIAALYGFSLLKDSFFPPSSRPQFMYHHWLPQGTDIRDTSADLKKIEKYVLSLEGVTNVSTFVGGGATRFLLTYSPEDSNSAYGLLLIDVEDYEQIDDLARQLYNHVLDNFPDAQPLVDKFSLGPGQAFKIQARFSGPDDETLRQLANQAMDIFREHGQCQGISTNWREQVKVVAPQFSEAQARRTGITRPELAVYLQASFSGAQVGVYREQNKLIPIISRPPADERLDVENINDIQIWSPVAERAIPLRQIVSGFETEWQDNIIARRDRKRTITVRCTPMVGDLASEVLNRVKPRLDAMPLPSGYALAWGGDYEDSERAVGYILGGIPVPVILMVFTLVLLFNTLRQPAVILLTAPLAVIGVAVGLLATNESFGFMAMLGFLSLSGMLIKNAIVLIDEINAQLSEGKDTLSAIMDSGTSRLRPVAMAAATTVLGMIPLFTDPFYIGMAVTIVSGLTFATVLTMVVVPVLYATLYRVPYRPSGETPPPVQAQAMPKEAGA